MERARAWNGLKTAREEAEATGPEGGEGGASTSSGRITLIN